MGTLTELFVCTEKSAGPVAVLGVWTGFSGVVSWCVDTGLGCACSCGCAITANPQIMQTDHSIVFFKKTVRVLTFAQQIKVDHASNIIEYGVFHDGRLSLNTAIPAETYGSPKFLNKSLLTRRRLQSR